MMSKEIKNKMPSWIGNQTIQCPQCGSMNRLGNVKCDMCGELILILKDKDFWGDK